MTPLTLSLLLMVPASDPPPSADPKPVAATREEEKALLEAHKKARPRLPMPPAPPEGTRSVNNANFRAYYLSEITGPRTGAAPGGFSREPDPAMTLDNTFKVKLFWITSRTNNCYYCLGHQEQKLLVAGLSDDDIAALDGDWSKATPAEKAAFAFTRKLTFEPHNVTAADVDGLKKHYTPTQVLEIVVTVAGYNATNRWTDGLNIPAEDSGVFRTEGKAGPDLKTFKTPTSSAFAKIISKVAPLPEKCDKASQPVWPERPAIESRAKVEEMWTAAKTRKPTLPVAEGSGPQWERVLAAFPKSNASRISGMKAAAEKGLLSPRIKAEISWAAARTDRAWYAAAVARERLKAIGFTDDQVFALDGDNKSLPEAERAAIAFARKLTAAPATVTDVDVENLRKLFKDKEVAEIVHHVCNAAFFNRVTEVANLPLDK
jgi:alkylhydroperoxidase family enzyme